MKKFISILLAITLIFSVVSVVAFAEGEDVYRDGNVEFIVIENEAYITKVLNTDEGAVAIPPVVSKADTNKITAKIAGKDISGDDNETDDPYDDSFIHVVAILDGAFLDIESAVKSVTLPVYLKEIGNDALRLINLEKITVHEKNQTFSSLNGSLYNKAQTTFFLHPAKSADSSIASTVTSIMPKAFEDSSLITSVTIPAGVTEIPDYCFNNCTALETVNLGGIAKIGEWAFSSTNLTSAEFGDSISKIAPFAFYDCDDIDNVVIPETAANVTVGSAAFFGCPILNITLYRNVTEIGDHAFGYYYQDMVLKKYPTVITGYKYTPDKTATTNTFAYAVAEDPGYTFEPFEFHPLDPIYSVNVTATDPSISLYNAQMFLYKNKTLKYTAESDDGQFSFKDVSVDDYSVYVLTQFGVLVKLDFKASVTEGYVEDFSYATDKYAPTGDLNRDGIIDMSDVSMLLGGGNYMSANPACDINLDGIVDVGDIAVILNSSNYAAVSDKIVADHSTPTIPIP